MSCTVNELLNQAKSWLGCKESNGTHKKIIDVYNAHKPLARGYKVKYSDNWCATFVSACAIKCGATDIIPTECSCGQMIDLFKKKGIWEENDNIKPKAGYIIMYDWDKKDGWPDHVGIVEKVSGSTITVIEGNKSNAVERRTITVGSSSIRGYGKPKYKAESKPVDNDVKNLQNAINLDLKPSPRLEEDNKCGSKTKAQMKKVVIKKPLVGANKKYPNITKFVQGKIGANKDGKYGPDTKAKVKTYQKKHGLTVDGIVGYNTLMTMLVK